MPTLDPRLAGLTNSGNASRASERVADAGAVAQPLARADHGVVDDCGRPRAAKTTFIIALSMPTADASTPQPT